MSTSDRHTPLPPTRRILLALLLVTPAVAYGLQLAMVVDPPGNELASAPAIRMTVYVLALFPALALSAFFYWFLFLAWLRLRNLRQFSIGGVLTGVLIIVAGKTTTEDMLVSTAVTIAVCAPLFQLIVFGANSDKSVRPTDE